MSKILAIIAPNEFRDEEYFIPKQILEQAGFSVESASLELGEIFGAGGRSVQIKLLVSDINPTDYEAVYFVGGPGMIDLVSNQKLINLAKEFFKSGKITAAICSAVGILANAQILRNISATSWSGMRTVLLQNGANVIPKPVVWSGKIITAEGPGAASEFAQNIIKAINS